MRNPFIQAAVIMAAMASAFREARIREFNIPFGTDTGAPHSYPNGPGWTRAQVKRMARKTKNRAKHRARVRAKGRR